MSAQVAYTAQVSVKTNASASAKVVKQAKPVMRSMPKAEVKQTPVYDFVGIAG